MAGFALLGLWQLATAVTVHGAADRLKSVGKGVGYLALAGVAARVALNAGGGGEEQTQSLTATAMQHPLGIVAVVVVGGGVLCIGVYHVVKGWFRRFLDDLRAQPPRAPSSCSPGRGTWPRGSPRGVVGVLFMVAAATNDPEEAGGLDAALRSLLELPGGSALLTAVGLGITAYGVYSLARARYARV